MITLVLPGRCLAVAEKLCLAAQKNNRCNRCITDGDFDVPVAIACVVTSLSHMNAIRLLLHR